MAGQPKLSAQVLQCPQCSANVRVRGLGQTQTLVCEYCAAVIDLTTLKFAAQDVRLKDLDIPLGTRGTFEGITWECIGLMVRSDGTGEYLWQEYLLFNPYHGFRWLVEANGHWNYVTPTKEEALASSSSKTAVFHGDEFRYFLGGQAVVRHVIGEFYWEVHVEDTVKVRDYIAPPRILSFEGDGQEQTWSVGQYLTKADVLEAFPEVKSLPNQQGVAPNQPSPYSEMWAPFMMIGFTAFIILTCSQILFSVRAKNQGLFSGSFFVHQPSLGTQGTIARTSQFTIQGKPTNVAVRASAPVDNKWLSLDLDLESPDIEDDIGAEMELSYYHGVDSDGSWSEGSQNAEIIFPHVPPGQYTITINSQSESALDRIPYNFSVVQDVSYWGNYMLALFMIFIPFGFIAWRQMTFEHLRWKESDEGSWVTNMQENMGDD